MASKKKKKGKNKKKLTKRFTKHLKQIIKVHGTELALGFVTGIITKLIAEKVSEPTSEKKKTTAEEQPGVVTAVKEKTKAVARKVKAAVTPKIPTARKTPVRKTTAKPVSEPEPNQE